MTDPVWEWPIEIEEGKVICVAPLPPVEDKRSKLGVRHPHCETLIGRFFTVREIMEELRTHIANVIHDMEIDWGELYGHYDVPPLVTSGPPTPILPMGGTVASFTTSAGTLPFGSGTAGGGGGGLSYYSTGVGGAYTIRPDGTHFYSATFTE